MEALDIWNSNYTKLLYRQSNALKERAGECMVSLSSLVADSEEFRGNMSPQRVMEIFTLTNVLESKACHDTDAKQISEFLEKMHALLDDGSLSAHAAVSLLVALSASSGLLLPFFRSAAEPTSDGLASNVSLNAVPDEAEERNERLWAKLCARLTQALVAELAARDVAEANAALLSGGWVEGLLLLNAANAAWLAFKSIRTKQLERTGALLFRTDTEEDGSKESWDCLMTMPAQWRQFSSLVRSMVECDVQLLPLFDVGNALDALINLYLDAVCEQIHAFVTVIDARLFHRNNADPAPTRKTSAPAPKSSGGGGILIRTRRRVSPEQPVSPPPPPPDSVDFDDISSPACDLLGQDALLLIVDTLSSWCQLEAYLLQLVNDFWSNVTLGLDLEGGSYLRVQAPGHATTSQKPKGVLKKLRRGSRRPSSLMVSMAPPPEDFPRQSTESPQVQEGSAVVQPYLEWQAEMEALFPTLARSLEAQLVELWAKVKLNDDQQMCANSFGQKFCSLQDCPQLISAGLWDYLHLVERVVPLLVEGCQTEERGPELLLYSVFTYTLNEHLGAVMEAAGGILKEKATLEQLIVMMSNLQCLQDTCQRLGLMFMAKDETSGSSFWDWRKRLGEQLTSALDAFERQWQLQLLTSVLQDAESHHWAEHKELYEDERCSFALQFWRLSLERLWQRLSRTCAADLARAALRRLLMASGRCLRQRYLNARPTPRRLRQFRADILAIFCVMEDFLCKASTTLDDFLGTNTGIFSQTRAIHSEMMGLLHVLIVVGSPLSDFYGVHRKGFFKIVASTDFGDDTCFSAGFWLSLVNANLYGSCLRAKGLRHMLATHAICAQLKLLCACPGPHLEMVLRILSMFDAALSMLFISQAPSSARALYAAFFRTFALLPTLAPKKLSRLVLAAVKKLDSLAIFSEFYQLPRSETPAVLDALLDLFEPYTAGTVDLLLSMAHRAPDDLGPWLARLLSPASQLPCGCRADASAVSRSAAAAATELQEAAQALGGAVFALPEPLLLACAALQAHLEAETVAPAGGHVIPHLLLQAVLRGLRARGANPAQAQLQALWSALKTKVQDSTSVPEMVDLALSGLRFEEGVDFSQVFPEEAELEQLRENRALETAARDATCQPLVCEELKFLFFFLKQNRDWIFANMGFGDGSASPLEGTPSAEGSPGPEMVLEVRSRPASPDFNVLREVRAFDPSSDKLVALLDGPELWSQLVANANLGLSRAAFLSLMAHRPDFNTDAFLEEHEKKMIADLKEKFRL